MAVRTVQEHPDGAAGGRPDPGRTGARLRRLAAFARTIGMPLLVVAFLLASAVAVLRSEDTTQPERTAEFAIAPSSYLSVQLDPSAEDFGSFALRVRGSGWVRPDGRVQATPTGADAVQLRYDGAGSLDPDVPDDGAAPSERPRPRPVRLVLSGQVGRADHTAALDVRVDDVQYTVASPGPEPGAEVVAGRFMSAFAAHDWAEVYRLCDRNMINGTKLKGFVDNIGLGAGSLVTDVTPAGPTTWGSNRAGASFAQLPIRVSYRRGATTTTVPAQLVLVLGPDGWKVFTVR